MSFHFTEKKNIDWLILLWVNMPTKFASMILTLIYVKVRSWAWLTKTGFNHHSLFVKTLFNRKRLPNFLPNLLGHAWCIVRSSLEILKVEIGQCRLDPWLALSCCWNRMWEWEKRIWKRSDTSLLSKLALIYWRAFLRSRDFRFHNIMPGFGRFLRLSSLIGSSGSGMIYH